MGKSPTPAAWIGEFTLELVFAFNGESWMSPYPLRMSAYDMPIRHADMNCRSGATIVQVVVPVASVQLVLSCPVVVVALEAQYCAPTPDHVTKLFAAPLRNQSVVLSCFRSGCPEYLSVMIDGVGSQP